jgi:isopropylmalate/homocitrate/citramalate synthase
MISAYTQSRGIIHARVMEKMQAVSVAELVRMADTVGMGAPTPALLQLFPFAG